MQNVELCFIREVIEIPAIPDHDRSDAINVSVLYVPVQIDRETCSKGKADGL